MLIIILILMPVIIPLLIVGITKFSDRQRKNAPPMPERYYFQQLGNTPAPVPPAFPEQPMAGEHYGLKNEPAPEKKKVKSDMTASNVLFLIGTIFVVLSGLAFGAASWVHTSHLGRVLIIAAAAVVAFALSGVVSKALKLSGTAVSFYVLGTGFVSTAVITAGHYQLMGEWFSLDGRGSCLLLSVSSVAASMLFLLGMKIYEKLSLIYSALSAFALSLLFMVLHATEVTEYRMLIFMTLQVMITAALHIMNAANGRKYQRPIKLVGTAAALIYVFPALIYAIAQLYQPTAYAYYIVIAAAVQLAYYGISKNIKSLICCESIAALLLSSMLYSSAADAATPRTAQLIFTVLLIAVHLLHCFVPRLKTRFTLSATGIALVLSTITCIDMMSSDGFVPELLIAMTTSAIICSYVFSDRRSVQRFAGMISPVIPFITASTIGGLGVIASYDITVTVCYSLLAAALIAFAAVMLRCAKRREALSYAGIYANMLTAGAALLFTPSCKFFLLIPAAICLLHFALSNKLKNNYPAIISTFVFIKTIHLLAESFCTDSRLPVIVAMFVLVILFTALSRYFYPDAVVSRSGEKTAIDPFMTTAFIGLAASFGYTRIAAFFTFVATAVYCTGFIKKNTSNEAASMLLTFSTILTAAALVFRPFMLFDSAEVTSKITIGIIALTGTAFRIIRRRYKLPEKKASQIIYILSFIALLIDAMAFDTAGNTIFVMAIMIFVLITALISRSKTWFMTSAASLFVITVFATREYLMALNWWIYLFIAGVLLISLAAANEYCKKNNETLKSAAAKKFGNWTW